MWKYFPLFFNFLFTSHQIGHLIILLILCDFALHYLLAPYLLTNHNPINRFEYYPITLNNISFASSNYTGFVTNTKKFNFGVRLRGKGRDATAKTRLMRWRKWKHCLPTRNLRGALMGQLMILGNKLLHPSPNS